MTRARGTSMMRAALVAAGLSCAQAAFAQAAPPTDAARAAALRRFAARRASTRGGVDERVKALAKGLELDPLQQAELRRILVLQQQEVRQVWADRALPAADHVGATRAILQRTGDRIRAILTDAQRKKYPAPTPPRGAPHPQPDLDRWLQLTRAAPSSPPQSNRASSGPAQGLAARRAP